MNDFIYNNPKLQGKCIAFSHYGSVLLKKLFKENKMRCKVQVKRYIINENDKDFSPYHYYIEIKTPTGKIIIDNCDSYNYWFYMDKYKPRGSIEKVKCSNIKIIYKYGEQMENETRNTILYHFDIIKKNYKF